MTTSKTNPTFLSRFSPLALASLSLTVAIPNLAQAQPAQTEGQAVTSYAEQSPVEDGPFHFTTLDRVTSDSVIGNELSFVPLESTNQQGSAFAMELFGQLSPQGWLGLGIYGQLRAAQVQSDQQTMSSGLVITGAELGGLFTTDLTSSLQVVARVGMTLAQSFSPERSIAATGMMQSRIADVAQGLAAAGFGRASVSALYRHGDLFARADVGFDKSLHTPDLPADSSFSLSVMRANAGVGVSSGRWALTAELATAKLTENDEGEQDSDQFMSAALSLRGHLSRVEPYFAIGKPLGDETFATWFAALGVSAEL